MAFGLLTAFAFSIAPLGRAHDLPVTTLFRDLPEERQGWPRTRYLPAPRSRAALRRACYLDEPATDGRDDGRRRDALALSSRCGLSRWACLISRAARPARARSNGAWRSPIHRPGALTPSVVISLGLGLAVLVALALVDANLRAQLARVDPA